MEEIKKVYQIITNSWKLYSKYLHKESPLTYEEWEEAIKVSNEMYNQIDDKLLKDLFSQIWQALINYVKGKE